MRWKMDFDKSKVYTALNADKIKQDSKVICAFSLSDLKLFDKIRTKDGNKEAIVTRIDKDSTYNHIFAGQWLSDEKLEEWEKSEK